MKKLIILAAAFLPLTCMAQKQIKAYPDTASMFSIHSIPASQIRDQLDISQLRRSDFMGVEHYIMIIQHEHVTVSVQDDNITVEIPGYTYTIEVDSIKSIEQQETRKVYPFNLKQQP